MDRLDLTGQKIGKLTVLRESTERRTNHRFWECLCECGRIKYYSTSNLRGSTKSCGCSQYTSGPKPERRKYSGDYKGKRPRLYNTWINMNRRCHNPTFIDYPRYGARGIYVCDEWREDFEAFNCWAQSNGWEEGRTLDRVDNDGPYCPENCRWATLKEQANNKRTTIILEAFGETLPLSEWCERYNVDGASVIYRMDRGMTAEEALTTSPRADKSIAPRKVRTLDSFMGE